MGTKQSQVWVVGSSGWSIFDLELVQAFPRAFVSVPDISAIGMASLNPCCAGS